MQRATTLLSAIAAAAALAAAVLTVVQARALRERIDTLEARLEPAENQASRTPNGRSGGLEAGGTTRIVREASLSATDLESIAELCALAVQGAQQEGGEGATPDGAAEEAPDDEVREERALALREAEALIDEAQERGRWTEDDRLALSGLLGQVSQEEAGELARRVVRLLNEGALEGPPGPPI